MPTTKKERTIVLKIPTTSEREASMTTYSIRLEIPDTDLYNTDIEKIIYDGIKPIVLNKIENVLIDVIEIETEEEQINNQERNRRV